MGRPPSMPVCSAVPLELTAAERHQIKKMAYGHKTPHQARQRATIVLLAARGRSNAQIAAETHLHVDIVRRWRGRFAAGRVPAPGRPQAVGAASDVHRVADRRSQGADLPVAQRVRSPALALVMPRTRARGRTVRPSKATGQVRCRWHPAAHRVASRV
ncbi:helix-turn-helix domain-containing protein [Streptomyces sp. NPDC014983]|uniref:helix-turn-helix domain-containing protein n=1 Tax=Streptomyces sp. NPDC014983 TaxID=3364933 RepID=UPI0036FD3FCC